MTRQSGDATDLDFIRQGTSPASGFHAESFPRWGITADIDPLASGVMLSTGVPLQVGDIVTSITFKSGATAANTPTRRFAALYDPDGVLLAQSPDLTTAAWAANTVQTHVLATPQIATRSGMYYAGLAMSATDLPTLLGRNLGLAGANTVAPTNKVLAQSHGSSLTDTAPATIATPTSVALLPYVVLL